jgi:hypothetical protein
VDDPKGPAELDAVPAVGPVEGRVGVTVGRADGAACGRKLVGAADLGAGLGGGVGAGLGVATGGFGSAGLDGADDEGTAADFVAGVDADAGGLERPAALDRLEVPPLATARVAAASAGRAGDWPLELELLTGDAEVADEGTERNGVATGSAGGAAGRGLGRADPAALDADPAADVSVDAGAASFDGTGAAKPDPPARTGAGRAGGVFSPSVASLCSPDFTSEVFAAIGDAPPPGIRRDVLSGR